MKLLGDQRSPTLNDSFTYLLPYFRRSLLYMRYSRIRALRLYALYTKQSCQQILKLFPILCNSE